MSNNTAVESNFWTVFFSIVAMWAAITTDCLSEEMDDPDNIAAWNVAIDAYGERIKAVPVHTPEHRFCLMSDCPCHDDEEPRPFVDACSCGPDPLGDLEDLPY